MFDVVSLITGDESDIDSSSEDENEQHTFLYDSIHREQNAGTSRITENVDPGSGDCQEQAEDDDVFEECTSASSKKTTYRWLKKEHAIPYPSCVIDTHSFDLHGESLESPGLRIFQKICY